jgi:hypothetical protein
VVAPAGFACLVIALPNVGAGTQIILFWVLRLAGQMPAPIGKVLRKDF